MRCLRALRTFREAAVLCPGFFPRSDTPGGKNIEDARVRAMMQTFSTMRLCSFIVIILKNFSCLQINNILIYRDHFFIFKLMWTLF